MNKAVYLPKAGWKTFVEGLTRRFHTFAPVEKNGVVVFERISGEEAICLDRPAQIGPKGVIFPQSERLFSFTLKKNADDFQRTDIDLNGKTDAPQSVILCARPCDARGFATLDPVMLGKDPYYTERRAKTTIITYACAEPFSACFCTSAGGGPADKNNSDLLVTALNDGYYLEAFTDKGLALLDGVAVEDGEPYAQAAGEVHTTAEGRLKKLFKRLESFDLERGLFRSEEFWEEASQKCLSCGACTYLCPTCHCFNITDEQNVDSGERIRSWDSCMFPHYTRETSGHNPRSLKALRLQNRVGHKFVYHPERYDDVLCSGCGRCIRYCPVSVDISRIVAQLAGKKEETVTELLDE
jgi:sulfhydrogenase subunit beta (sulfur reductase)